MDKYEYKVRADEIKTLIAEGRYDEAVTIADTIDWRRVKSVMMLCTISDLYKINRRYEDSRDILLLAYERHTGGRLIVYSLCELSIKLGEFVQALEYYKEFVQLSAPEDVGRYVLRYKIFEAQEVSLEERIEVLEELKKVEHLERWEYELAYLYHRVGLASKCVAECDELFVMFSEGKYVLKALELKMLYEPLSEEQQLQYDQMKGNGGFIPDYAADQQTIQEEANEETEDEEDNEFSLEQNILTENTQELPDTDMDIQVKTVDVSQYNTINLQKELAESMKEFLDANKTQPSVEEETEDLQNTQIFEPVIGLDSQREEPISYVRQDTDEMQPVMPYTEEEKATLQPETSGQEMQNQAPAADGGAEVFFGNTEEVNVEDLASELAKQSGAQQRLFTPMQEIQEMETSEQPQTEPSSNSFAQDPNAAMSNTGVIRTFHKPSGYDNLLSQEYDGQISLVVPEQEQVEKQITGQLSIEDIMAEWERMKQENERRRMEEIRQRVHQQTDTLFADFDESTKSGLLEELETAMVKAAIKGEKSKASLERPKVVKVADIENTTGPALTIEPKPTPEEEKPQEIPAAEAAVTEESQKAPEVPVADVAEAVEETQETQETPEVSAVEAVEETQEVPEETTEAQEALEETTEIRETSEEEEKEASADEQPETDLKSSEEEKPEAKDTDSKYKMREMTSGEREQFAPFIHHKKTRRQIVEVIDNISMASYTGNVVITGEEGTEAIALAKLLVKEVQLSDSNFSGKVAKISGATLNKKDVGATLAKLFGGALIIETAADMKKETIQQLLKVLNQEGKGIIVLLEDTKAAMDGFLGKHAELTDVFNLRVDVEALDDQTLVKYAKKYAKEQEYTLDELGVLALHTRIADMQTSDHEVTLAEIEELVDEAIYYADRKTPKHFFDVLFGKRYDEEDMIILREKDFMHY